MFKLSLLALVMTFTSVSYANSKNYSYSVNEINAVLKNEVVKKTISAQGKAMVTSVAKEDWLYHIGTNNGCVSTFRTMYNGVPMPGAPAVLSVQLVETNCIPSGGVVGH